MTFCATSQATLISSSVFASVSSARSRISCGGASARVPKKAASRRRVRKPRSILGGIKLEAK